MVYSSIQPKIEYNENIIIDKNDNGHISEIYEMELYNTKIKFVLGKPNYKYSKYNIVYFSIYLIYNNKIRCKIGIFEQNITKLDIEKIQNNQLNIYDLNIPIFFSFINNEYLIKNNKNKIQETIKPVKKSKIIIEPIKESELKLNNPMDIFIIDNSIVKPQELKLETQEDYNENIYKYENSNIKNKKWINNYFKNNNYNIINTKSNGDCFFDTIRIAFHSIGFNTTIDKLRKLFSINEDIEVYNQKKIIYDDMNNIIIDNENNLNEINKELSQLHNEYSKPIGNSTKEKLKIQYNNLYALRKDKIKYIKQLKNDIDLDIGYMKNLNTFDKYKNYLLTNHYWADNNTISLLEYLLNIKFIILSYQNYNDMLNYNKNIHFGDNINILTMAETNKNIQDNKYFNPDYYIIISYSGSHYELISYHNKSIFKFNELPYEIKFSVVLKIIGSSHININNPFVYIDDFKNLLKNDFGIDLDNKKELVKESITTSPELQNDINTIFYFDLYSDEGKPGENDNEIINNRIDYIDLEIIKNWRNKLDDKWIRPNTVVNSNPIVSELFILDSYKWLSVEHYMQAIKYKKSYKSIYLKYCLDEPNNLSQNILLDNENDYIKDIVLSEEDINYYEIHYEEERTKALIAKFSNPDLKHLLLMTKNATLFKEVFGNEPYQDNILMKVRKIIKKNVF